MSIVTDIEIHRQERLGDRALRRVYARLDWAASQMAALALAADSLDDADGLRAAPFAAEVSGTYASAMGAALSDLEAFARSKLDEAREMEAIVRLFEGQEIGGCPVGAGTPIDKGTGRAVAA